MTSPKSTTFEDVERMKNFLYSTVAILFLSHGAFSQKGNSFLTHYSPKDERIDFRSSGMVQDSNGLIYFTNKKGVLEFDGNNWQLISTPSAVYTISLLNNEVYVGGIFGFGKLISNEHSQLIFQSLSTAPQVFSSAAAGKLYACSEELLLVVDEDKIQKEIRPNEDDHFLGLLEIHGHIFIKTSELGLMQVEGDKIVKPMYKLPVASEIIFSSSYPKTGDVILGTDDNRLFSLKANGALLEIKFIDQGFLSQNRLVSAAWVNENLIACGTLLGGVILVNAHTGATEDIINYDQGLPDNEVFAMLGDQHDGVWVAHEYGFTRIAPSIPFRSFNHYPGLSGNLLCVKALKNQLYVGTTLGLFQLVKEVSSMATKYASATEGVQGQSTDIRRGLFGFLKRRTKETLPATTPVKPPISVYKSVSSLERFSYKRVEGISGKVSQLIEVNGQLVGAGLAGVFEINNLKARSILPQSVHAVFFAQTIQQLLVSTYQDDLKVFTPGSWKETQLLDTLRDNFSYIFEDEIQNIWLCGREKVYRVETVDGQISDVASFPISNPSLDQMVGVAYGNDVYLANSGEFKIFDRKESFVKYDSFPGPHRYFASAGYFWFNDGTQWRTVDKRLKELKLQWLGLFPNLRFLAPDENAQNLWVITANNELYKFSGTQAPAQDKRFPLLLRHVSGQEIKIVQGKQVTLDQPETEFSFDFIQPDYVSNQAMQYRYQVKGLTSTWTSWSNSNHIASFPFLPPGSYQLAIQSRDLLGNESKIELISFKVLAPFWKRWWFYALEFVFFAFLVFISVKVSGSNIKYKYLSDILSLLSVIIFIQFISTAINSIVTIKSTPVVQFFIQVSIALLVFPAELYFRRFMDAAAKGKIQIKSKRLKQPENL